MSTRYVEERSVTDPAERLAVVAKAKRGALLHAHRHALRYEDLEDCFSQATVELVRYTRLRGGWSSTIHLEYVLEQRFVCRVWDRCRAMHGRSPIQTAMERALTIGGPGSEFGDSELVDLRCGVEELVMLRMQLRGVLRLTRELTADQRLVLLSQVSLEMTRAEFCERYGWTREKYRKVAQRGRAKLRQLGTGQSGFEPGDPPMKIPPPLIGASPGTPAAGHGQGRPVIPSAMAAGGRATPRLGLRPPAQPMSGGAK